MMNRTSLIIIGMTLMLTVSVVEARKFTTAEVLSASATPGCSEYCITGVCVWLVCTLFGCSVDTSAKIGHTSPDYVVSSYREQGENAWAEMAAVLEFTAKEISAGLLGFISLPDYGAGMNYADRRRSGIETKQHANRQLFFKEATVIGNPGQIVNRTLLSTFGHVCPVDVIPNFPYFQSELDTLAWRNIFGVEMVYPATWLPGKREVGSILLQTWGSVHPRQGFLTGTEGPKVAAVIAQRAIDITSRKYQPHIYVETGRSPSNETTDRWQMISPKMDEACGPFGQDANYALGRVDIAEDYGFLYWGFAECCTPKAGVLIGTIETPHICVSL